MAGHGSLLLVACAPADRFAADTVCNAVADVGMSCDVAPQDPHAREAIAAAASAAGMVVIVHSRATAHDAAVLRVAEAAAARRRPMLVVRVDDSKPGKALRAFLRGVPSIDATGGKLPERVAAIVARVKGPAGSGAPQPASLADAARGIEALTGAPRRVSPGLIVGTAVVVAALGLLAWRGFDRSAAQSAYDRGVAKIASGDLEAAAVDLDDALSRRPDWQAAWRQRGFASRDRAVQITSFTRAIALDPTDADALAARGRAYFATGDLQHARDDLSAALLRVPDNAEWLGERGLVALSADDAAAAERDFAACARRDPRCAEAFAARIAAVEAARGRAPRSWF